jgi:hypothetical protein
MRGTNVVFCDGGLCNRLNALLFALVLRQRLRQEWQVAWPRNNWCGAGLSRLFELDLMVTEQSLEHFRRNQQAYKLLMHENQADFDAGLIHYHRDLPSMADYERILLANPQVLYYHNLLPPFLGMEDIKPVLGQLRIAAPVAERAGAFCRERGIDASVVGLHIRKTDFGNAVDDEKLFQLVSHSQDRFFVCSDDAGVNARFGALPNCAVFEKTAFPNKLTGEGGWNSRVTDSEGRQFHFNINRSEESIVEALVDLLILSRTRLINTSPSTFLRMALIFQAADFFQPELV